MTTSKTVPEPTCTCGEKLLRVTEYQCFKCDLVGDRRRLDKAERIIGALWPLSATVLEAFGKYMDAKDRADLMWAVAEAQKFLKSNRSHG